MAMISVAMHGLAVRLLPVWLFDYHPIIIR